MFFKKPAKGSPEARAAFTKERDKLTAQLKAAITKRAAADGRAKKKLDAQIARLQQKLATLMKDAHKESMARFIEMHGRTGIEL